LPLFTACVPLSGLIVVTAAILLAVSFVEKGRWRAATRTVDVLCIYPGFALAV